MAVDALESALSFYVDDSRPLPEPSIQPGLQSVSPSALECIKPGFYREMMAQGKFEKPLSPKNK
jgi:antitoxin HicB